MTGQPLGPTWADFEQVTALLEELTAAHADTRATLDEVLAALTARSKATRPVLWDQLTADEAQRHWDELGPWVRGFVDRHALTSWLPSCWAEHRYLVEELSVLRLAWNAAYTGPAASFDAALGWLEAVERFRSRIQDRDKGRCNPGHPMPALPGSPPASYPDWSEPEAWQDAFAATVRRDVERRRAAEPPTLFDTDPTEDAEFAGVGARPAEEEVPQ